MGFLSAPHWREPIPTHTWSECHTSPNVTDVKNMYRSTAFIFCSSASNFKLFHTFQAFFFCVMSFVPCIMYECQVIILALNNRVKVWTSASVWRNISHSLFQAILSFSGIVSSEEITHTPPLMPLYFCQQSRRFHGRTNKAHACL